MSGLEEANYKDSKTSSITTSLFEAAENGDVKKIESLLNKGVDINVKIKGRTLLHIATFNGHKDVVDFLCENGADIEERDMTSGLTPLSMAVSRNHSEVARTLRNHIVVRRRRKRYLGGKMSGLKEANYKDSKTSSITTCLFGAAQCGDVKKIESLLNKGGDINVKMKGQTLLQIATFNGRENVVDFLCKNGADIEERDISGLTPLNIAISRNHPEVVKTLLNHKADAREQFQMASIILKHGSLLDICSLEFSEPSFLEKLFDILLNFGDADVNAVDTHGRTPLHLAILSGQEYMVKKLVAAGADINAKSFENETPWYTAIYKGHVSIVEFFLNNGADVHYSDSSSYTPLHRAVQSGRYVILNNDSKSQEKFADYVRITKMLLEKGASVNASDTLDMTPLHHAARIKKYRPEIIRCLLDHGADVNSVNKYKRTPIFFTQNERILWMLIERGADINYVSVSYMLGRPYSALSSVCQREMVEVLLEKRADLHIYHPEWEVFMEEYSRLSYKEPGIFEALINQMTDLTPVIHYIVKYNHTFPDLIPIIVRRKAVGEIIEAENYLKTASTEFCKEFTDCEMEILKMKHKNISSGVLGYFDILVMPINQLTNFAKKEELNVISCNIEDDFPLYAEMLKRRIDSAKKRRILIDAGAEALQKIIFNVHERILPDIVIVKIVLLLSNMHLTTLAQV